MRPPQFDVPNWNLKFDVTNSDLAVHPFGHGPSRPSAIGHQPSAISHQLLSMAISHRPFITQYSLLSTHHSALALSPFYLAGFRRPIRWTSLLSWRSITPARRSAPACRSAAAGRSAHRRDDAIDAINAHRGRSTRGDLPVPSGSSPSMRALWKDAGTRAMKSNSLSCSTGIEKGQARWKICRSTAVSSSATLR